MLFLRWPTFHPLALKREEFYSYSASGHQGEHPDVLPLYRRLPNRNPQSYPQIQNGGRMQSLCCAMRKWDPVPVWRANRTLAEKSHFGWVSAVRSLLQWVSGRAERCPPASQAVKLPFFIVFVIWRWGFFFRFLLIIKACLLTVPLRDPAVQNLPEPPAAAIREDCGRASVFWWMTSEFVSVSPAGRRAASSRFLAVFAPVVLSFDGDSVVVLGSHLFCKVCVWIHQVLVTTLAFFLCCFCCSVQIKVGQFVNNNKVCKVSILSSCLFGSVCNARIWTESKGELEVMVVLSSEDFFSPSQLPLKHRMVLWQESPETLPGSRSQHWNHCITEMIWLVSSTSPGSRFLLFYCT